MTTTHTPTGEVSDIVCMKEKVIALWNAICMLFKKVNSVRVSLVELRIRTLTRISTSLVVEYFYEFSLQFLKCCRLLVFMNFIFCVLLSQTCV